MEPKVIHVLIAGDNAALRSALALLLEMRLKARIVGEAHSMEDLLLRVACSQPDVVILDWDLPGFPRAERVMALREVYPPAKIVIASSRPEVAQQVKAIHADAFISKSDPPEDMVRVLQEMGA